MAPGSSVPYNYTYQWTPNSTGPGIGHGSSVTIGPGTANNTTSAIPTQNTGIPIGLFVIAAAMVGAGVGYAKFLR